jgi:hypothetical protein
LALRFLSKGPVPKQFTVHVEFPEVERVPPVNCSQQHLPCCGDEQINWNCAYGTPSTWQPIAPEYLTKGIKSHQYRPFLKSGTRLLCIASRIVPTCLIVLDRIQDISILIAVCMTPEHVSSAVGLHHKAIPISGTITERAPTNNKSVIPLLN